MENRKKIIFLVIFIIAILSVFVILYLNFLKIPEKNSLSELRSDEKVLSQEEKDMIGYADAVIDMDEPACKAISDENLKKSCIDSVYDSTVFQQAISTQDSEVCKGLRSEIRKNDCITAISLPIVSTSSKESIEEAE